MRNEIKGNFLIDKTRFTFADEFTNGRFHSVFSERTTYKMPVTCNYFKVITFQKISVCNANQTTVTIMKYIDTTVKKYVYFVAVN